MSIRIEEEEISTGCYLISTIHTILWNIFLICGCTWLVAYHQWSIWTYLICALLMKYGIKIKKDEKSDGEKSK
jgi:hypothetical protein